MNNSLKITQKIKIFQTLKNPNSKNLKIMLKNMKNSMKMNKK